MKRLQCSVQQHQHNNTTTSRSSDKKWRHYCFSFIIKSSLHTLTFFKFDSVMPKIIHERKDFLDFISDLINKRFHHKNDKTIRSNFLRIYFDNKGIEDVNISRLLHEVKDVIPKSFADREIQTVLYTRTPSIGSTIFNYKNVFEDLETSDWNADNVTCDCSTSELSDPVMDMW